MQFGTCRSTIGLIGRLDRVLRSAARLIGHLPKYTPVSAYMRDVLHWLPDSQRISYRVDALVWRCLLGCAPSYLSDLSRPVSDLAARRTLRSSNHSFLAVAGLGAPLSRSLEEALYEFLE